MEVAVPDEVEADPVGPESEVVTDGELVIPAETITELVAMEEGCPPVAEEVPEEEADEDPGLRANPV